MTDPIEAVARAIEADMFAAHELPVDDELHAAYRITARAAIAAFLDAVREPRQVPGDAVAPPPIAQTAEPDRTVVIDIPAGVTQITITSGPGGGGGAGSPPEAGA